MVRILLNSLNFFWRQIEMKAKSPVFKQYRYPWPVIETAVQLQVHHGIPYRTVSEQLVSHGVEVSHKTIFEWVQKFQKAISGQGPRKITNYSIEETYVKCSGHWKYMYRAYDKSGKTLSVLLREKKNLSSAKNFFNKYLLKN